MKLWIVGVLIVCAAMGAVLLSRSLVVEAIEIDMKVKISDHFGLNADNDALRFGMIMPGTEAERGLMVSNRHDMPVKVTIRTSGAMEGWVRVSENNFDLLPGEGKNVTFTVHPLVSEYGEYEGKAVVVMRRELF